MNQESGGPTLSGFDNFTGFETAGADAEPLCATRDKGPNRLQIRIKTTLGAIVGVAHSVSKLRPLAAYFTSLGHCAVPPTGLWI
jgi:hypothetical protein